jgi:hypothetical protein
MHEALTSECLLAVNSRMQVTLAVLNTRPQIRAHNGRFQYRSPLLFKR